jgi:hypothetical protein
MHLHFIKDSSGDVVDNIEFCSDSCHREWAGEDYQGWNGCYDPEFDNECHWCEYQIPGSCGAYVDFDRSKPIN